MAAHFTKCANALKFNRASINTEFWRLQSDVWSHYLSIIIWIIFRLLIKLNKCQTSKIVKWQILNAAQRTKIEACLNFTIFRALKFVLKKTNGSNIRSFMNYLRHLQWLNQERSIRPSLLFQAQPCYAICKMLFISIFLAHFSRLNSLWFSVTD